MSEQGIDLSRSGWENPEGFKPRARDTAPVPPVPEVCGDRGPNGWECEMNPNHQGYKHWADNGTSEGVTWEREKVETTTLGELAQGRQSFIQGPIVPDGTVPDLDEIREIAEKALKSESPAAWVLALDKIRGMVS